MGIARQVAALPVRREADGELCVLLVTSRDSGRWIIPKGWPMPDRADHLAAAQEAHEEAGVTGRAGAVAIGTFGYDKRRRSGTVPVVVTVYLLEVEALLDDWPERRHRRRRWFSLAEATGLVQEPELQDLMRGLEQPRAG